MSIIQSAIDAVQEEKTATTDRLTEIAELQDREISSQLYAELEDEAAVLEKRSRHLITAQRELRIAVLTY